MKEILAHKDRECLLQTKLCVNFSEKPLFREVGGVLKDRKNHQTGIDIILVKCKYIKYTRIFSYASEHNLFTTAYLLSIYTRIYFRIINNKCAKKLQDETEHIHHFQNIQSWLWRSRTGHYEESGLLHVQDDTTLCPSIVTAVSTSSLV